MLSLPRAFVELVGQTGSTLTVTAPGEYKLVAHYIGSACVGEDTILVEFYPDLFLNTPEPNDLSICTSATTAVFDLTQNTPVVLASFPTPSDYTVTYFLTEADALANTNAIVAQAGTGTTYAAGLCKAYNAGGYTDWYLPAKNELQQCYNSRQTINTVLGSTNGFQSAYYWSSTEDDDGSAWYFYVGTASANVGKNYAGYVRAVRAF